VVPESPNPGPGGNLFLGLFETCPVNLRELLSKLKWDPREDFAGATIRYLDRSKDERGRTCSRILSIMGREILEFDGGYMIVGTDGELSHIPFHRVREVVLASGKVVWKRGV
jgi:uncharacterized protein (UPF0248 family)